MSTLGIIRDVVIEEAGQHGLGITDALGWVIDSVVEAASTDAANTYSCVRLTNAFKGSRAEDLTVNASGAQHAVHESSGQPRIGGITVLTDSTGTNYLTGSGVVWSRSHVINFSKSGELVVGAGTFKMPFAFPARLICVRAAIGVAPTGASVIVDMNKNGTTVFSGGLPTIAATEFISTIGFPVTIHLAAGDYLTVDIDQIGSTLPGEDLTVTVQMENDYA